MSSKSEARQKKLFLDTPILKTILIVALPSIVVALMSSLYAFIDQLMMVKFIPDVLSNQQMFGNDYNTFALLLEKYKNIDFIKEMNVTSVVRTAIAYSAPITVVINAASLLIANGTAVNFSRSSGSTNKDLTKRSWALGFYMNLFFSLLITATLLGLVQVWMNFEQGNSLSTLKNEINTSAIIDDPDKGILCNIYTIASKQTNTFAVQYSYIISAGTIFSMYTSFLSLLIISEGKQMIVTTGAIVCNLINILLDWIFIYFCKLAMIGGAIATVIGWGLNAGLYFLYLYYLETKNETQMHYSDLKHMFFTKQLFWSIFSTGLPSLLRNISVAIAATVQLGLIAWVLKDCPSIAVPNETVQSAYGAVNPIFNLFFTAELGIIQGSRIVCSYSYGAKNFERFRKTYWYAMAIGFIYGIVMVVLLYFALCAPLLSIFGIKQGDDTFEYAKKIMLVSSLQMPVFAFSIGGMMMFQSTGRWIQASACGMMQGVFCNFTISFLMEYLAVHYANLDIFLWNPFVVLGVASIIIFVWSFTYCYKKFVPSTK